MDNNGNLDEIGLIENLQRENLNPIEEAQALESMMVKYGYTQESLGKVIGKARTTVNQTLCLNALPDEIKSGCPTSDTLTKSILVEIAQLDNKADQLALWQQARSGSLTVKAVRECKKAVTAAKNASSDQSELNRVLNGIQALKKKLQKTTSVFTEDERWVVVESLKELIKVVEDTT